MPCSLLELFYFFVCAISFVLPVEQAYLLRVISWQQGLVPPQQSCSLFLLMTCLAGVPFCAALKHPPVKITACLRPDLKIFRDQKSFFHHCLCIPPLHTLTLNNRNYFTFLIRGRCVILTQTGPDLHTRFRRAEISCAFPVFGSTPQLTVFPKCSPQFLQRTVPLLSSCAFKINLCYSLFQYFNPLLPFLGHDGYSLQSPDCSL